MRKKLTIAQYARAENVKTSAIYQRIDRGTLKRIYIDGKPWVFPHTDTTIRKPRKKTQDEKTKRSIMAKSSANGKYQNKRD